jgi:hypothetical protein
MQYIIDVREEDELKSKRLISKNPNINIINIPTSIIRSQVNFIKDLSKKGKVYIACRRGIRSTKIKNEYFSQDKNITSIGPVDNASELFTNIILHVEEDNLKYYILVGLGLLFGVKLLGK